MTVEDLRGAFSYSEKPELPSQVYNDAADGSEKPDPFKEESSVESSISENKDELVPAPVRKSPRSLCLNYYRGEAQPLTEAPLVRSAVVDVGLNISQPQSFLDKENVCKNGDNSSDRENCFEQLDLRAIYKAEEVSPGAGVIKAYDKPKDAGVFVLFENTGSETFLNSIKSSGQYKGLCSHGES